MHVKLNSLRQLVVMYGLPKVTDCDRYSSDTKEEQCTLRGTVWKVLLGVPELDTERYLHTLKKGASRCDEDIHNDTFR